MHFEQNLETVKRLTNFTCEHIRKCSINKFTISYVEAVDEIHLMITKSEVRGTVLNFNQLRSTKCIHIFSAYKLVMLDKNPHNSF